ncbi:MAG: hypothetical protein Q4D45_10490 [Lachnospiraceae bacterium]|nr:hypothetical protein [Lachnospiraceae bacterium]
MLKMEKEISFTGRSVIDDVEVVGFSARFKSDDPENITFSSWQINKELYKANRAKCRADEAQFEDAVYEAQDEMIAEAEKQEVTES